jgi:hypothetical protein
VTSKLMLYESEKDVISGTLGRNVRRINRNVVYAFMRCREV